jgi:2-polyprenyl-3-methyl-5-hydroxy-6-metoxy-1,4-benzoquinol methylase
MSHAEEIQRGDRFEFGANWTRFLTVLDDERIAEAKTSLKKMLGVNTLEGKSFLDVGSGSGLFSLAARSLGASVHSFDYDPKSVACTQELRRRYFADDPQWTIEEGSVLDSTFLCKFGTHDIVYSWGVLHHTGQMNNALDNVAPLVKPGGQLFIAIYNDQGGTSRRWTKVKQLYCSGLTGRMLVRLVFYPYFAAGRLLTDIVRWQNPVKSYMGYKSSRGMSVIHDWEDWLGGYPFEVAKPEEIFERFQQKGFMLEKMKTCAGGLGCNEFVFKRRSDA